MTDRADRRTRTGWWLALTASAVVLAVHVRSAWPYLCDDALISLRYADRLLAGQGLTWTDGERVEGYSNLLWILATAGLGALGLDLVTAARVLGVAATGAALVLLLLPFGRAPLGALAAGLALGSSASVALWTIGGLEQPLLVAAIAGALAILAPRVDTGQAGRCDLVRVSALLGMACLTRIDAPLLAFALAFGWFLASGQDRRAIAGSGVLLVGPALAVLGQMAFRLGYYGDWLPNVARVRIVVSDAHVDAGAVWLVQGLVAHWALVALAALAALVPARSERPRMRLRLVMPILLLWPAYLVWVGGDIFPAFRQLVPIVLALAFLAGSGVQGLVERASGRWRTGAGGVVALALVATLGLQARRQHAHPEVFVARYESWVWEEGQAVGRFLGAAFSDARPLVAVSPAGCVPFWSRLPSLDMLGLNDRFLATHPPADRGRGFVGHESGNGAYVLSREPDLVLFCGPRGGMDPCFPSEKELASLPAFRKGWRLVTLYASDPVPVDARVWARLDSPRIGVRRANGRIHVPALFLETDTPAVLSPENTLVRRLRAGSTLRVTGLDLEPGPWRWALRILGEELAWEGVFDGGTDVSMQVMRDTVATALVLERAHDSPARRRTPGA
ncbi:MAG: hypothetical protein JXB39_12890 [Deltaproteobacteria bacterium]|nr:hypothetical protein [Deltaproteobacteria bacterium]